MRKALKIILGASILLFVLAYFRKDRLPGKDEVLPELYREPIQAELVAAPFRRESGGITYEITPLYSYELYGLVVSYHKSGSWVDFAHKDSKDYINTKDIAVIWGENIATEVYQAMKFKSGQFTCWPSFKSGVTPNARSQYKNNCLSNNHLLAADENINKAIMSAKTGDQIHLQGYLAEYSHGEWRSPRRTSKTRDDYGCEVIYVTEFEILKKANSFYRLLFRVSKYLIAASVLVFTLLFFFGPVRTRR